MIARPVAVGLLLIAAVVAQTAVFPLLPTSWYRPDLLLLVVVAVALADGPLSGIRVGFVAGLLADLLVALLPAGVGTLVLTVIGFGAGVVRPFLAAASISAPLIVAFVTGLLGTAAYGLLALLLGDERVTWGMLAQASVGVAIFNMLLSPLVLAPVARLLERFPRAAVSAD